MINYTIKTTPDVRYGGMPQRVLEALREEFTQVAMAIEEFGGTLMLGSPMSETTFVVPRVIDTEQVIDVIANAAPIDRDDIEAWT